MRLREDASSSENKGPYGGQHANAAVLDLGLEKSFYTSSYSKDPVPVCCCFPCSARRGLAEPTDVEGKGEAHGVESLPVKTPRWKLVQVPLASRNCDKQDTVSHSDIEQLHLKLITVL